MKQWRFEISTKDNFADRVGNSILEDIQSLNIKSVTKVSFARVFLIEGEFNDSFADRIAAELLTDPVCEDYAIGQGCAAHDDSTLIEVHLKSGVTDPVAQSVTVAIADMGQTVDHVRTAKKYILTGKVTSDEIDTITKRILANDCIEEVVIGHDAQPPNPHLKPYQLKISHWPIRDLTDQELIALSKDKDLFLDLREMQTIQAYFRDKETEPTDIELETIAQTWSEHCVHKTLKSSIDMTVDGKKIHFDNMLKETVFGATQQLNKDWCISVFDDNAGVVEFDDENAICFKVETHNHPSALDPYGGAATGIGGVIRDPMGTGMGAKPIANTDIFCFGEPDKKLEDLPKGVLHPKRIMKGVVSGVRDYGNRMGIPTVNGALYFDDRYIANPLVFCGNIGLMDRKKCFKHQKNGNLIMVVGGKTGRDGIHGATFSSGEMTHEHETIFSHAVQIGDAITEKKTLDVLLQARDAGLYESITDCGAGGLSSAVGEMGEKLGAEVDLEKIPLKYAGLNYTEIWISEAQERMVIAVKPECLEAITKIFDSENVQSTVIGRFTDDKKLKLKYNDQVVSDLDMEFLHNGVPKYARQAKWNKPKLSEPKLKSKTNYNSDLTSILSSYNVASKEWVIRQYDHEIQGSSVIKPLTGVTNDGPSDAAVIKPKYNSDKGIAISCGMNPIYGDIDPYQMAMASIDEAIRNLICVGGRADRICILDNFCWPSCNDEEALGSLVRAAQACYDGAIAFGSPFISGKDSLNNQFIAEDGTKISIPSTLLISAMSLVDDINKCITMDAKKSGNLLFVAGQTKDELGGSHYYKINDCLGANVPQIDLKTAPRLAIKISQAIAAGLIESCHDCSEGGLAVAVSEMGFAGGLGIAVDLDKLPKSDDCQSIASQLFSESLSRYILEVKPENQAKLAELMGDLPFGQIGNINNSQQITINDSNKNPVIDMDSASLKDAWQKTFNWK